MKRDLPSEILFALFRLPLDGQHPEVYLILLCLATLTAQVSSTPAADSRR